MLATLTHKHFSDPEWIFERKLDGERALAFCRNNRVRLMTRNRKVINDTYPELVQALGKSFSKNCILDGEVVAFEGDVTSFSRLQKRMQIRDEAEARKSNVDVYYYLFDILYFDKYRLDDVPLSARKSVLKRAIAFQDPLRFTTHRNAKGEAYLREACDKGWEGLIAKRAGSHYQHKRSTDWLKFKCQHGQELVIGGFTEPHGSRTGFGALLVGYYEDDKLRYAGKVGTGYDEETLMGMRKRFEAITRKTSPFDDAVHEKEVTWLSPTLVGEFGFTEWTEGGKLRHPRFLGLRRDKNPEDVVREEGGE
jgi:bifunctional non-homologous end joining protein LigD